MSFFDVLGFEWDRSFIPHDIPIFPVERAVARFHEMLPEFVWDAAVLEGNPFSLPEIKTLIDGITVGGHKIYDEEQILNLIESSRRLISLVKSKKFALTKTIFVELNGIIARNESLEWGVFRGEGEETHYTPEVGLGRYGRHTPHATEKGAPYLNRLFEEGVVVLERRPPFERALAFFLFGALHQFFFDGNKRTSRLMMNGILMSNGMDAISIPAARVEEFNEKMVDFYRTKDGTEMMAFLASCHPYWEEKMREERSKRSSFGLGF